MSTLRPLTGSAGLAVARARHPATVGGRPDAVSLARRLCDRLEVGGAVAPEVGAAVAATRGAWCVDQARFAELLGLSVAHVGALERGEVGIAGVPAPLLMADPFAAVVASLRRPA